MKKIVFFTSETLLITALVLLAVSPFSCRVKEHGLEILQGDSISPTLEEFETLPSNSFSLLFSEPVALLNAAVFKRSGSNDAVFPESDRAEFEGKTAVSLSFEDERRKVIASTEAVLAVGEPYVFYAEASDKAGNSLSLCIPFSGWNENPAALFISGVYTLYSGKYNRHEFVELECTQSGNIAGFSLSAVSQKKLKLFSFPSCEILKGEKIVLHFCGNADCVVTNESGKKTNLARGWYCTNKTRDFWFSENENTSLLFDNKGIVLLENDNTKKITDAFLYASDDAGDWKNAALAEEAKKLADAGIIADKSIESAFRFKKLSSSTKATKMFCKKSGRWMLREYKNGVWNELK